MSTYATPGVVSSAPEGASIVGPTAALNFKAESASVLGERVVISGSTRQSGWENTVDGVYDSDFLNVGSTESGLVAVGESSGAPYEVRYANRQRLTRDGSGTTAHVEKFWEVFDPRTWKVFVFSTKYTLATYPTFSVTSEGGLQEGLQF